MNLPHLSVARAREPGGFRLSWPDCAMMVFTIAWLPCMVGWSRAAPVLHHRSGLPIRTGILTFSFAWSRLRATVRVARRQGVIVTTGHTAIVTGANHGIGAATAAALARGGCAVLCTFLRVDDPVDPGTPQTYRDNRAHDATAVTDRIREDGGRAVAVEADLSDPAAPALLFDTAEEQFGPVDVLVNNATGWLADTFAARHIAREASWGRIIGLASGGELGFPEEVSYGAAKAAQVNYTMSAALELAPFGITANMVYPPVTDTGWVTDAVRDDVAANPLLIHIAS